MTPPSENQGSTPGRRGFVSPPPDWLKAASPESGQVTPTVPEWLNAAKPPAPPRPGALPDWLAQVAEVVSPDMAAAPPSMPPAPKEPERFESGPETVEPESADEGLFAAMRSETPMPPAEQELPDFLAKAATGLEVEPDLAKSDSMADIPDWMQDNQPAASSVPSEPAQSEAIADIPDWMQDNQPASQPVSPEPAPLESAKDVPDWMKDSEPTPPPAPPEPAQSEAAADVPDWLKDSEPTPSEPAKSEAMVDNSELAKDSEATPVSDPFSLSADVMTDIPDWMKDSAAPAAPEASQTESAVPDWLSDVAPPPPVGADIDKPDWLKIEPDSQSEPKAESAEPIETPPIASSPVEAPSVPTTSAPAADVPDWLNTIAAGETAAPAPAMPAPTPASPAPAADVPDWLNTIAAGETTAPAPAPASPAPAADVPDWLTTLAAGETAAPAPASPAPAPASPAPAAEAPDWLNTIAAGETAAPASLPEIDLTAPAPASTEATKADEDLLDWMSGPGLDLGGAPASAPPTGEGEDLLGMTGDFAITAAEEKSEEGADGAVAGELPEWLRGLKPTAEAEPGALIPSQTSELSPEDLGSINDLRFDKLISEASRNETATPEKVGALKDVSGAIRPELIFDAQTLKAGKLVGESILTKEQERRILLLESLLAKQEEAVVISGARRGKLPLIRWLIALLLIAAIVAPTALGISALSSPAAPSGGVSDAKKTLDSLPPDAKVVVAFEYEPDAAAEMEALAGALLKSLADRDDISVIAISAKPTGPVMADRMFKQANPANKQWVNLGYVPGGSVGISGLAVGSLQSSPLAFDYLGQPTHFDSTTLFGLSPSLIIVFSATAEDLRAWVEQAGRPSGVPMIAATSASVAPMAMSYRQSNQLVALMSGVNDAVAYRALAKQKPDQSLTSIWNAQAFGALAAMAMIIIGGLIYGLIALREQQEQNA